MNTDKAPESAEEAPTLRDLFNAIERLQRSHEVAAIQRVMALKPDENGRIKLSDIRKAHRG